MTALRLNDGAAVAIIFLYTLLLCIPAVFRYDGVSLYDEITHFDYAYKLTVEHSIPTSAQPLSDAALAAWACRDSDWADDSSNLCERAVDGTTALNEFPIDSIDHSGFKPILYYSITGFGAQALAAAASPVADLDLFDAMRIMSVLWLAAGACAFQVVMSRWTGRPALTLAASLLLVSLPAVTLHGFTITPDAGGLVAGAAAIAIAARMACGRPAILMTAGLSFLVVSTNLLSIVAILSVASIGVCYALTHLASGRHSDIRQWAGPFAGALLGTAVSYAGAALLTRSAMPALPASQTTGLPTEPPLDSVFNPIADTIAKNVGLISPYWMPGQLNSPEWAAFSRIFVLVLIAIPFITMWTSQVKSRDFILGLSLLTGALLVPVFVQTLEILTRGEYFPLISGRYSLSLVPLSLACLAIFACKKTWGDRVVWMTAGLAGLLAFGSIHGIFTM